MFEYLQSDDVSHENVEERNASSFFFLFFLSFFLFQREIKSVIKVYGIGRGWMSAGWREIVRLFVLILLIFISYNFIYRDSTLKNKIKRRICIR